MSSLIQIEKQKTSSYELVFCYELDVLYRT
nr:hypothetical protein F987_03371 [Acinetobacter gyllenbergii NIPH 230]